MYKDPVVVIVGPIEETTLLYRVVRVRTIKMFGAIRYKSLNAKLRKSVLIS